MERPQRPPKVDGCLLKLILDVGRTRNGFQVFTLDSKNGYWPLATRFSTKVVFENNSGNKETLLIMIDISSVR